MLCVCVCVSVCVWVCVCVLWVCVCCKLCYMYNVYAILKIYGNNAISRASVVSFLCAMPEWASSGRGGWGFRYSPNKYFTNKLCLTSPFLRELGLRQYNIVVLCYQYLSPQEDSCCILTKWRKCTWNFIGPRGIFSQIFSSNNWMFL